MLRCLRKYFEQSRHFVINVFTNYICTVIMIRCFKLWKNYKDDKKNSQEELHLMRIVTQIYQYPSTLLCSISILLKSNTNKHIQLSTSFIALRAETRSDIHSLWLLVFTFAILFDKSILGLKIYVINILRNNILMLDVLSHWDITIVHR